MERLIPRTRVYLICALLFFASAINYMDRQTLATVGKRVTDEFQLTERQYGTLEKSFGFSFAAGSFVFGIVADRFSIRYVYPFVLFLWSLIGFLTGFVRTYEEILICRGLLGFFEAGHWPCGLKATQLLLSPSQRSMGNGVLQSGTSIGAILIPLVMLATLTPEIGSWRLGFQFVGAVGIIWIIAWFAIVRKSDYHSHKDDKTANVEKTPWWNDFLSQKLLIVVLIISLMNATWQTLRAWLPKILQQEYGFSESFTSIYTSIWYAATDVGCLLSGAAALYLYHRGFGIKRSRTLVFATCSLLCSFLCFIPLLTSGATILAIFLLAGAGTLGLFPIYYSFSQDISMHHQGKVAGFTGVVAWLLSGQTAELFGWLADTTGSFRFGIAVAGVLPFLAFLLIALFWPQDNKLSNLTRKP